MSRLRQTNWMSWAYALVCAPLVLLLIETIRGAVYETRAVRVESMTLELGALRSQAMQRAKGLEVLIGFQTHPERRLADFRADPELVSYWSEIKLDESRHLYAAVVDRLGTIVLHTDPAKMGQRLERGWYDQRVPEAGFDITLTRQSALGGERLAYDVSVPLAAGSDDSGEYHEGLDAAWLDSQIAAKQRAALGRWAVVLALVGAVNVGAVCSLIYLAQSQSRLQKAVQGGPRQRAREMAQLGSGLAHEIRNPLHAVRINLHTLRRALGGRSKLPEDQVLATIEESDAAIDRLDGLMRDLLQYSDPTAGQVAQVDLVHEVRATLRLLAEDLRRQQIQVRDELPNDPAPIAIDPARLRQSLLNVLTFAQHRAGKSGAIEVSGARRDGGVEVAVGDSGPAIPSDQQPHLFEPFQAPAETGSGLGLALVQAYVEEIGGRVSFGSNGTAKSRCHLWFPLAAPAAKGVAS